MFKKAYFKFILVLFLIFSFLNIAAADTVDVSGDWQGSISSNHTITAAITRQGNAMPWIPLLLLDDDASPTLSFIEISGPIQVNESSTAEYTLTAYYIDGSSAIVTNSASWSENSGYASISSSGILTTSEVTSDQPCTITASYGGKSGTHSITIKNVSSPFTTTYTITGLPLTDYDGNYTLEWTGKGLVSSNTVIQEDSDNSFSSPTNYISYAPAHTYLFTDKDSGTYCYRVGANLGGTHIWSEPRCVTVNIAPSVTTLHVVNNTHYIMIDIQLNGAQKVSHPNYIGVGQSADFEITPGTVNFYLGVGFYDPIYHTKNVWFTYQGTGTVNSGQTGTVTFNNPTIGDLLSGFKPAGRDWTGEYYCYSCPTLFHMAKFHFGSNGGWTLYDDNVAIASGTVSLTSWQDYATSITFNLNDGHSPVILVYPFGQFSHDNGPSDWPTIVYTAQ